MSGINVSGMGNIDIGHLLLGRSLPVFRYPLLSFPFFLPRLVFLKLSSS
jgi:hypothetical protein